MQAVVCTRSLDGCHQSDFTGANRRILLKIFLKYEDVVAQVKKIIVDLF